MSGPVRGLVWLGVALVVLGALLGVLGALANRDASGAVCISLAGIGALQLEALARQR